jgi:MFS transporter, AAHS family, 4-hydroxybenzoate transporter
MSDVIDVQKFLNEHGFSGFQWLIFALCFAIVFLDGFDTAAIGYIAPALVSEWGLERSALGPVLTAALFGLSAGALFAGPLGDRFGRRKVLVGSVFVFGAACLTSAFSGDLTQLVIWRFITGVGLGAAMPNAVTMMSEYCPDTRRATLTNAMFCGFPLGAAFGGFLAAWIIPQFGWRSVLLLGGITPLVLTLLLALLMPESVRYMVSSKYPVAKIRDALQRISRTVANASSFVIQEKATTSKTNNGIRIILSKQYLIGTLMLLTAYFMGLVIFYSMINWMPILFKDAGLSQSLAAVITALFPLGGVFAVLSGWLMDRFNANLTVAICFVLTGLGVWSIGQAGGHIAILASLVLLAGVLLNTAQTSLPSLAAAFYPTQGRATGIAWMMALGRFGGIAGSFLVAELARRNLSLGAIFTGMAIPGFVAGAALLLKQLLSRVELTVHSEVQPAAVQRRQH